MRIVSPFLKRVVYPSLARARVFRHAAKRGLAIVTYHGILPAGYEPIDAAFDGNLIGVEMFRRQLRLLKASYKVITPEDMLAWCEGRYVLPERAVLLTCDDGLLNNLTDMLPILLEEKLRCLFFVTGASTRAERRTLWYEDLFRILVRARSGAFEISCAGMVLQGDLQAVEQRRSLWWNAVKTLSQHAAPARQKFLQAVRDHFGFGDKEFDCGSNSASERRFGLLTRSELKELADAGMTIGAHTLSHPMLSQLEPELARVEISESEALLESAIGQRVWAFAYPFGDSQSVSARVIAQTKEVGYQAAFLNFGGGLGAALPKHALPRTHITAEMNLAEFEAHIAGFYASMQRWAGRHPDEMQVA
jgi:peptidoglycan/xylan/chitin deacetylase (PgdA/CDA1 family)